MESPDPLMDPQRSSKEEVQMDNEFEGDWEATEKGAPIDQAVYDPDSAEEAK